MGLLTKAVVEQSHAKIAGFGPGGSGKSLTLTLIAIALSKTYHGGAPIALLDTEKASDWLVDIYATEKVDLLRVKSKSFVHMKDAHKEAIAAGCCAFLADSYSHPWAELQSTLKKRLKVQKLEFHHMQELQDLWSEWVDDFLYSPIHCLFAGRLAYEWENEVDVDTGKMGFHKAGTKLRSEKDAGYEPHLLFEMQAERVMTEERETKGAGGRKKRTRVDRKAGGHFIHKLHVLKDRARVLNGKEFTFKDINDYKAGDWKTVFNALKPHFEKINIASGVHAPSDRGHTSEALLSERGDPAYAHRIKRLGIVLEEFDGTLRKLWPGETAKEKALRNLVVETVFHTRSWKAVESKSLESLEAGYAVLRLFEHEATHEHPNALTDATETVGVLKICQDKLTEDARLVAAAAEEAERNAVL